MSIPTMILVNKTGEIKAIQHARSRGSDGKMATVFCRSALYKKANTLVADGFTLRVIWTCTLPLSVLRPEPTKSMVSIHLYGKCAGPKNMVNVYSFPNPPCGPVLPQMYGHCLLIAFNPTGREDAESVVSLDEYQWNSVREQLLKDPTPNNDDCCTTVVKSDMTSSDEDEDDKSASEDEDEDEDDKSASEDEDEDEKKGATLDTDDEDKAEELECDRKIIQALIDAGITPVLDPHGYIRDGFIVSDTETIRVEEAESDILEQLEIELKRKKGKKGRNPVTLNQLQRQKRVGRVIIDTEDDRTVVKPIKEHKSKENTKTTHIPKPTTGVDMGTQTEDIPPPIPAVKARPKPKPKAVVATVPFTDEPELLPDEYV